MFKEFIYNQEKFIINLTCLSYVCLYELDNEYRLELSFDDGSDFGLVVADTDLTDLNCLYEEIKKVCCK